MKIDHAYLCSECQEIQQGAPKGACFVCGSQEIFPLSWLLRKRSERVRWLELVSGRKRHGAPGYLDWDAPEDFSSRKAIG